MAWIGKIAGGLLGYAAARLPGAVVGVILGHQFDRGLGRRPRTDRGRGAGGTAQERQRAFFEATFLVMGHLAKADGRVSEAEIGAAREVMHRMRLDERQVRVAIGLFNAGKQPGFQPDEQLARLRRYCGDNPPLLRTFLEIQVDLVLAKGAMSAPERELLGRIAAGLGLGPMEVLRLEALLRAGRQFRAGRGGGPRRADPDDALTRAYSVLGVSPGATDGEVKTAYRRLMNEHHPDKQAARGLPESMLELAKERTSEIRAAYETVRDHRGFR